MNSSPNSERTRLARELHDGLAQELAAFGYRLDQVIGDENLGSKNRSTLRDLRLSLSAIINQVRDEIYGLRTQDSKSFYQQVQDQVQPLLSDTSIIFEVTGEILPDATHKYELLRVIRELVLNAKRYANCQQIKITLEPKRILVVDDGGGGVKDKPNSFGMTGVIERLALIGAQIKVDSTSAGTLVEITF
ncbi:MAG: sensor histidine kinase [Candidatus Nanopelagicus sp.]